MALSALIVLFSILFLYNILTPVSEGGLALEKKRVIGLVVTPSEDDWKMEQYDKIAEAVYAAHDDLMRIYSLRSQASQIEQIRALIVYQVDVIVFSPLVENGWSLVLNEAAQAGIEVVAVDQGVRSAAGEASCHQVSFAYEAGAESLIQKLADEALLEEEILELVGPVNAFTTRELSRGYRNELDPLSRPIRYSYCAESLSSYAEEITQGVLDNQVPIKLILAQNDAMAEGAATAVAEFAAAQSIYEPPILTAVGGGSHVRKLYDEGQIQYVLVGDNTALVQALYNLIERVTAEPGQAGLSELVPLKLLEEKPSGTALQRP